MLQMLLYNKYVHKGTYVRILSFLFSRNNLLSTKTWTTPTETRTIQLVKDHHSTLELLLSTVCLWRASRALKCCCMLTVFARWFCIDCSESCGQAHKATHGIALQYKKTVYNYIMSSLYVTWLGLIITMWA